MIKLSVNINKIATLRNARGENSPSVISFAKASIAAGAQGITIHPRPDERHIRYQDIFDLREIINSPIEYNIEGYPDERYLEIINKIKPSQATLVPDPPHVITSNAGWNVIAQQDFLCEVIPLIKSSAQRVSLFVEPDLAQIEAAKNVGADRIELYTKSFADSFQFGNEKKFFLDFATASAHATHIGLGVNAGHDLNLENLVLLRDLPGLLEVSIGHALVCDALIMGWDRTIKAYLKILGSVSNSTLLGKKI